jgi:hypothetical protein
MHKRSPIPQPVPPAAVAAAAAGAPQPHHPPSAQPQQPPQQLQPQPPPPASQRPQPPPGGRDRIIGHVKELFSEVLATTPHAFSERRRRRRRRRPGVPSGFACAVRRPIPACSARQMPPPLPLLSSDHPSVLA